MPPSDHTDPARAACASAAAAPGFEPAGRALALDRIGKAHAGQPLLHELNLQVRPGEFVAVVGRSGCGKSTLLRLIAGLETPDAGSITLDGAPPAAPPADVRLLAQDASIRPWRRAARYVETGLRSHDAPARARGALAGVGLPHRAHAGSARLSAGERQRVALAGVLVHEPRLLLLDEPFGALDVATRVELRRLVEDLWLAQRCTVLMATHDVADAVTLADRVLLMEEGRIAWEEGVDLPRPRAPADPALEASVRRWTGLLLGAPRRLSHDTVARRAFLRAV